MRASQRVEPRCRDGAQPWPAPGPEPEHQAEREPELQPEPVPGRGPGPQGRAARSGGDGAPQRLRGFLPALPGGLDVASPSSRGARGSPHHIQDPETPRKAGTPPGPTQSDSPAGESRSFFCIQKIVTTLQYREDSPSSIWVPQDLERSDPPPIRVCRDPLSRSWSLQLHTSRHEDLAQNAPRSVGPRPPNSRDLKTARNIPHQQEDPLKARGPGRLSPSRRPSHPSPWLWSPEPPGPG